MDLMIVGANAAGLAAALEARRRNAQCRITVLDGAADVSWSTCDLPYSLAGGRSPEDLILRRPQDFLPRGITILVEHRVESLDLKRATLAGSGPLGRSFELGWDRLVLCSGVITRPLMDLQGRPLALPGARTLDDARALADRLPRATRVVIVGAGPIGLELADCLRLQGRSIQLVEAGPRPLPDWPAFAGQAVAAALERAGVLFHGSRPVKAVETRSGGYRVHLAEGTVLDADLVINASGVLPARSYLAPGLLAEDERGFLEVDSAQATRDARVFAAGDLVLRRSCVDGRLYAGGLALDARRGGRVAGANAVALPGQPPLTLPPSPGTLALVACGLELARTGHPVGGQEPVAPPVEGFSGVLDADAPGEKDALPAEPAASGEGRITGPGLLGAAPRSANTPVTDDPVIRGRRVAVVHQAYPLTGHRGDPRRLQLQLEAGLDGRLRAATLVAEGPGALRIDVVATLLSLGAGWRELEALDLAYTPPLGPAVDPLIQAARSLGAVIREHTQRQENRA
jgi:NADPH-dependent 2,4-dienoyl-CoA reductase/sulfur reductase-like enzyme